MKYSVLFSNNSDKLEADVELSLANGWELQGGISISTDEENHYYAQAMILNEKPDCEKWDSKKASEMALRI